MGGLGPMVDAPRLVGGAAVVELGAGAAVLVGAGLEGDVVVVAEAGLSGTLNRLLDGALMVAGGAVDIAGV